MLRLTGCVSASICDLIHRSKGTRERCCAGQRALTACLAHSSTCVALRPGPWSLSTPANLCTHNRYATAPARNRVPLQAPPPPSPRIHSCQQGAPGMPTTLALPLPLPSLPGKEASTSFAVLASSPAADLSPAAGWKSGLLFRPPHQRTPAAASTTAAGEDRGGYSSSSGGGYSSVGGVESAALRGASLVVCAPHTGRTHQIRVHLDHVGHPILGDDLYGITVRRTWHVFLGSSDLALEVGRATNKSQRERCRRMGAEVGKGKRCGARKIGRELWDVGTRFLHFLQLVTRLAIPSDGPLQRVACPG